MHLYYSSCRCCTIPGYALLCGSYNHQIPTTFPNGGGVVIYSIRQTSQAKAFFSSFTFVQFFYMPKHHQSNKVYYLSFVKLMNLPFSAESQTFWNGMRMDNLEHGRSSRKTTLSIYPKVDKRFLTRHYESALHINRVKPTVLWICSRTDMRICLHEETVRFLNSPQDWWDFFGAQNVHFICQNSFFLCLTRRSSLGRWALLDIT